MRRPTNIVRTSGRRSGIACGLALVIGPIGALQAEQIHHNVIVYPPHAQGNATFVTGANRDSIPVSLPVGRTAAEPMDFLSQYGHLFGVSDAAAELSRTKTEQCNLGQTHTTYQQLYSGVRVFGGVLKIHQDSGKNIIAANGHFFRIPKWLKSTPTLSPDDAEAAAQAQIGGIQLVVERNELVVVDPAWYGDPPIGAHLAYHVVLSDAASAIREAFFVDAHTAKNLDQWSLVHTDKERQVYTALNQMTAGTLWRSEGEGPTSNADVDRAYDYAGDSYDFFYRMFGRDGPFDNGSAMLLTVHWGPVIDPGCVPLSTPICCPVAFWDGTRASFCTGIVTPETVGHELAHGLMDATADLIYENQSGQLNESFSDVWGELIDLFNGNVAFPGDPSGPEWPVPPDYVGPGLDTPNNLRTTGMCSYPSSDPDLPYSDGVRWLHGEDRGGVGADNTGRDMWEPTCSAIYNLPSYPPCCPDRANHPLQTCGGPQGLDNGGNHVGSSIPNHAFAIVTDGKTFNGYTVAGIGPIKAAAVWYRALVYYLTPVSDFENAYVALTRAAHDLVGTYPNDPRTGDPSDAEFTDFDAEQVDLALRAVEMNTWGACGASADMFDRDPPDQCSPRLTLLGDDFESGVGGWTVENTSPPNPYDWVLTSDLLLNREGTAWFVEDPRSTSGFEGARHSLISPSIVIPTGINEVHRPNLVFTHYLATEYPADGGNVKISINDGPFELIESQSFEHSPYNATIWGTVTGFDNPLQGEPGWTGVAAGWATSLVDLSSLVAGGETIRIRFDFGKDALGGYEGWYVDDFAVYVCACNNDAFCDDGVFCN
ncbi:MAG: M4 family metallopeptidase, partial [Planctomycetota bacterium]